MYDLCVLLTTVDSHDKAKNLAHFLVEQRLAACVSVIPGVESVYFWQGAVQDEKEWLLVVKTSQQKIPAIREAFRAHHPYTVPEFVVLKADYVGREYMDWLVEYLEKR